MSSESNQPGRIVSKGLGDEKAERVRMEYVLFLKRTLRDLAPLNDSARRVLELVESALGPEVPELELSVAERKLLLDVVHILSSLLEELASRNPRVAGVLRDKLTALAVKYEVCPA